MVRTDWEHHNMCPAHNPSRFGRACLRNFAAHESGNIGVVFAFVIVPVLGLAGAALDYSRATSFKAKLQNAVDETALRSFDSDEERLSGANVRLALLGPAFQSVTIVEDDDEIEVSARGLVRTTLLSVLGIDEIPVAARARVAAARRGPKACLLALNEADSNAISFSGSSAFVGTDCAVYSNSRDPSGLTIAGNAWPQAAGFCSVGGASSPTGFTPPPQTRCRPARDPFAGTIKPPPVIGCDHNNYSVGPQKDEELKPGVYCGGLTVRGTARLKDGATYVFKDGELNVNAQGSLLGRDVLLYLTGSKSGFTINGGGDVRLHASKDGLYGGVLLYQDPLSNPGAENKLNGSSTTVIDGAIYTPGNSVRVNGSSGFGQESVYMPIIADKITVTGNTDMRIDLTGIEMVAPIPEMGQVVRIVE
jgi:hypothetical protein